MPRQTIMDVNESLFVIIDFNEHKTAGSEAILGWIINFLYRKI